MRMERKTTITEKFQPRWVMGLALTIFFLETVTPRSRAIVEHVRAMDEKVWSTWNTAERNVLCLTSRVTDCYVIMRLVCKESRRQQGTWCKENVKRPNGMGAYGSDSIWRRGAADQVAGLGRSRTLLMSSLASARLLVMSWISMAGLPS